MVRWLLKERLLESKRAELADLVQTFLVRPDQRDADDCATGQNDYRTAEIGVSLAHCLANLVGFVQQESGRRLHF